MVTENESYDIFMESVSDNGDFLELKNHCKCKWMDNTYQVTVNMISLEVVFSLMERDEVKNVFFHPSSPPPGTHVDGIAQRYRLYVEYYS